MKLKSFFASSFFLKSIFVISLIMLLFVSSISYEHTKSLTESSDLLMQSYKIQFQLEHVSSMLKDAETGQRGYIISHDTLLLSPYKSAEDKIYKSFLKLRSLIDDKQQNANLDTLHQLINFRFKLMAYSLNIVSDKPLDIKRLDENLLHGKDVMDKIRLQINKMEDLEIANFQEFQNTFEHEASYSPMSTFLGMIFSLLIFILSYIKITRDFQRLKKSNENLSITNESMKHAEIIGGFGISVWDLDNKNPQFSDNLYRLLGCEPQSFAATVETYLEYVHPDNRDSVKELSEKKFYPRFYRIVRKDGEIRYFTSMGKVISEGERKLHLEIVLDITDQELNKMAMEERNRELELSIKELESFNRVASHDLQEPLRKIQTFISRVSGKDKETMSDTGKEYLSKIEFSANRMRILIDDLLLFSSTNKSEKVFGRTDLNLLLSNAQHELAQIIEEKKAVIQSDQLPLLKVISFQIQQLFVNLIGNALKYSKPGISPEIRIECEKLAVGDYPVFISDTQRKYYKISISDNGLGFDQQHSESIFILFNRLHPKTDYPGTGIGLSICKKIVENHDGFIVAEGKPGVGAKFTIFLPA